MLLTHPGFYSVVAEDEGRIVGSNFLDGDLALPASGRLQSIRQHRIAASGGD